MQFDQLKRREFIKLLCSSAAAWPLTAEAQQGERMRRIGYLRAAPPPERNLQSFLNALAEKGYVQGRDFVLVPQWGDGRIARLQELAVALVNANVDIIVTEGTLFRSRFARCHRHHSDCHDGRRRSIRVRYCQGPVEARREHHGVLLAGDRNCRQAIGTFEGDGSKT
jgi:hypothetical protein